MGCGLGKLRGGRTLLSLSQLPQAQHILVISRRRAFAHCQRQEQLSGALLLAGAVQQQRLRKCQLVALGVVVGPGRSAPKRRQQRGVGPGLGAKRGVVEPGKAGIVELREEG